MPLSRKWKSLDFFGSLENVHLPYHHHKHDKHKDKDHRHEKHSESKQARYSRDGGHHSRHLEEEEDGGNVFLENKFSNPFRHRLSSLSSGDQRRDEGLDNPVGLVQRCVIIQKDERGYGLTVSGDNPVYVASVKQDGAAAKAGVQKDDRIVKVNGTLVTNRNHIEVVKLIKSGSYVALTLMGRPNPSHPASSNQTPASSAPPRTNNIPSHRDSTRITAPQPVDPDKDRELWQQKVHMTQVMHEQAKEDFEKTQRMYVKTPSEKLHTQLLEKERTVKTLENQLRQLTGSDEPSTPNYSQASLRFSNITDEESSSINSWATSLPVSESGSMSDSPQPSPSASPTPDSRHESDDTSVSTLTDYDHEMPMQAEIITIDDEDVNSEDEPTCDTGPFSDIRLLEKKPAHMAVLLHYLISNSDPAPLFFYVVSDAFKQSQGNTKDLRKWGYEIYSTFLATKAPLKVGVDETIIQQQVDEVLCSSGSQNDNVLRSMFDGCRAALGPELGDQLADFRQKRDLGLGSIFGVHELKENMDKTSVQSTIEKYLVPHLRLCSSEDTSRPLTDRDQAVGWALATFLRHAGVNKTSGNVLERVQSFVMKDKRTGIKFPGSRSGRTKVVKGHQFSLQHFYAPTWCSKCEGFIWGIGYQGYLCTSCETGVHKQCVEEVTEACGKKKSSKRASASIPVFSSRKPSNPNQLAVTEAVGQVTAGDSRSPPHTSTEPYVTTQPFPKDGEDNDFAGLPTAHSVKSIVSRYQGMTSPTGPGPGDNDSGYSGDRKGSADLSRSESLKGKGEKGDRPARRAKSDVDKDEMFRALNQQSGSSSASSLSNRSVESPSASSDNVNDTLAAAKVQQEDSDLDVDELPSLKQVLGEDILKKLKPKEKKRQEVINELFHTEKAHLRNLKVLDLLFNRLMLNEGGVMSDLSRALFPNIDEMIELHAAMNKDMKERRLSNPVVGDVGDILLKRFDGGPGEQFRKACAEYCRNQSFALEALKRHRRKDNRLSTFLAETECNPLCRKLELKDHVPCQMQRLTKYPMLIENLLKYTQTQSEEYTRLERALDRCKHILAYVNQAVRECENYHKLKDMQKRLDKRAIDTSADPSLMEIKSLDLTVHKLVFDGPLVWRLRSHRQIDLHVLLLEDILVLLQRTDDRLVLKCQSTNMQNVGTDYKYTHSPVLKLQNLLARNVATDKKAFFVINTSDTGPQIYELVAPTQDARKKWCKLINDKVDEHKRSSHATRFNDKVDEHEMSRCAARTAASPESEDIMMVRSRIMRVSSERSPPPAEEAQAAAPAYAEPEPNRVESIGSLATADYQPELIHPDQVSVSGAVTAEPTPVLSSLAQLRQQQQLLAQGAAGQNINVSIPMDQLRSMATEMNNILANLLHVMGTRGAERQSLRQELQAAQEQLDMLKAIQRQMSATQSPSTPQSRPQSFISVASSISETGEDSEHTEGDAASVLNVAQTQELAQEEIVEAAVETVQTLDAEVQPQVATSAPSSQHPDDDSDDGYEMFPDNLPLPDDTSITPETATSMAVPVTATSLEEVRREEVGTLVDPVRETITELLEPMTTDLDDGSDEGRTTPTPSPPDIPEVSEFTERQEEGEVAVNAGNGLEPPPFSDQVGDEQSHGDNPNTDNKTDGSWQQDGDQSDNNNGTSPDSELTSPIEI